MRSLLLIMAVALIAFSCGEAGFQLNVGKEVPYEFDVEAEEINDIASNDYLNFNGIVNVTIGNEDLRDYDLSEVLMNSVYYEIEGLPNGNYGNFEMQVTVNGLELITIPTILLTNSSTPLIIHPGGVNLNEATLELAADRIRAGDAFQLGNNAVFESEVPNDFIIRFYFDVTGKVRE